mmetsp:Transcript_49916/g.142658  ORF Transcript_49916/g.142658 Transcript_49916/m.142658 type:complete len:217 (+) Transcript_49916:2899-3549(+)
MISSFKPFCTDQAFDTSKCQMIIMKNTRKNAIDVGSEHNELMVSYSLRSQSSITSRSTQLAFELILDFDLLTILNATSPWVNALYNSSGLSFPLMSLSPSLTNASMSSSLRSRSGMRRNDRSSSTEISPRSFSSSTLKNSATFSLVMACSSPLRILSQIFSRLRSCMVSEVIGPAAPPCPPCCWALPFASAMAAGRPARAVGARGGPRCRNAALGS